MVQGFKMSQNVETIIPGLFDTCRPPAATKPGDSGQPFAFYKRIVCMVLFGLHEIWRRGEVPGLVTGSWAVTLHTDREARRHAECNFQRTVAASEVELGQVALLPNKKSTR